MTSRLTYATNVGCYVIILKPHGKSVDFILWLLLAKSYNHIFCIRCCLCVAIIVYVAEKIQCSRGRVVQRHASMSIPAVHDDALYCRLDVISAQLIVPTDINYIFRLSDFCYLERTKQRIGYEVTFLLHFLRVISGNSNKRLLIILRSCLLVFHDCAVLLHDA